MFGMVEGMSLPSFDVYYFGERWDAPAFDDAIQMPVPTGDRCLYCEIEITHEDSGTFQHYWEPGSDPKLMRPVHIECWFRSGMGSPAHMRGECSCFGKEEPEDPRSFYEQGKESIAIFKRGEAWFQKQNYPDAWKPTPGSPAPEELLP